jgi:Ca2+/Na+ antiporter
MTDSGREPMTGEETGAWAYLVAVTLTSAAYLALVGYRLATRPVEDVSWVPALIATIVASVVLTVAARVAVAVRDGIAERAAVRLADSVGPIPRVDQRDREIERLGSLANWRLMAPGLAVVLVLAMIDADSFWIGNAAFLIGTSGAVAEAVARIRAYRRGF